ncbi:TerC family protein [Mycoavidus sp. SF9855]|uniref:TerC family protein n=1 Tax=Mycoavidus sp. SF9855 TaxID=2968475 RepID=UPI00211C315F|nr:TerC family protein [Mycoavidus sp. SF9855]UUM21896.1 TerC family protein [Mycoavidus sp. SF9855]
MLALLTDLHWGAIAQIVAIDLLLGGDNAVVIALACRNLPAQQRMRGVLWGTAGAIVLRVLLIGFAVTLLYIPLLKMMGGLLLFWIGIKLMLPEVNAHNDIRSNDRLLDAIKTIIAADFVMSLDNVIAIAGAAEAAQPEQRFFLILFGLILSIPIIIWGSQLVLKLLTRFPLIIAAGAALLGWIAARLITSDPWVQQFKLFATPVAGYIASAFGAALVVVLGTGLKRRTARD